MTSPPPVAHNEAEFGQDGFRHDLRSLLIQMAPPYGFTLATFTAAGVTTYEHGAPHPLEILLFLVGAFIGYGVLALLSGALRRLLTPLGPVVVFGSSNFPFAIFICTTPMNS